MEIGYMLMFTLGPVQNFIAQARKTRDLWLGSYLFSMLIEAGMRGLERSLIFPTNPTIQGDISDLPNKYVAIFDKWEYAEQAAEQSKIQIQDAWNALCQEVWDTAIALPETSPASQIWHYQIDPAKLFEFSWVVVAGRHDQYGTWLTHTQQALDARKRLHAFA